MFSEKFANFVLMGAGAMALAMSVGALMPQQIPDSSGFQEPAGYTQVQNDIHSYKNVYQMEGGHRGNSNEIKVKNVSYNGEVIGQIREGKNFSVVSSDLSPAEVMKIFNEIKNSDADFALKTNESGTNLSLDYKAANRVDDVGAVLLGAMRGQGGEKYIGMEKISSKVVNNMQQIRANSLSVKPGTKATLG